MVEIRLKKYCNELLLRFVRVINMSIYRLNIFFCNFILFTIIFNFYVNSATGSLVNALTGALKIIFRDVYKAQNMSLRIIANVRNRSNQRITNEILDDLLNYNTQAQVPVAISEYSSVKLEHYFHAIIMFTESLKQVR